MLLAAEYGHVDVLQSLLQHRATVDLKDTVSAKINFNELTITVINFEFGYIFFLFKIFEINWSPSIFCIVIIMTLSSHITAFCRMVVHLWCMQLKMDTMRQSRY